MLKLRYYFERDIDAYRRYVCDDIWEHAEDQIAKMFSNKKTKLRKDFEYITKYPRAVMERVESHIERLSKEFDEKVNLLQHLDSYKQERKSQWINYIMLVIAAVTLWLVIYPDHGVTISTYLDSVIGYILSVLRKAPSGQ